MSYYEEPMVYYPIETPLSRPGLEQAVAVGDPMNVQMVVILASALLIGLMLLALRPAVSGELNLGPGGVGASAGESLASGAGVGTSGETAQQAAGDTAASKGAISPVFTAEVQYWADRILAWSAAAGVDPNMAATIMQIESCGDPGAASGAGAQGLFQVMPFHFTAGEDSLDPDTNARRGLAYFGERLVQTKGDVGRAFAGYNGGHVAAAGSWNSWANETQRYFTWSTGIYQDAASGLAESATLKEWLAAGGASLCRQAAGRLGI